VDLLLAKSDVRSWNMLEKPADESILPQGFNLTFGVGGRTGTVGAKEVILDESNKLANAPAPWYLSPAVVLLFSTCWAAKNQSKRVVKYGLSACRRI
jgi:hypothetical protein